MNQSSITGKRILFVAICIGLFLPMIQQYNPYLEFKPLSGDITVAEKPEFSFRNWFNESYQEKLQDYVKQNVGFSPLFIRLYNQLYYSLFQQARANSVVIGKQSYLYEEKYIKAYLGNDFIGSEPIQLKIHKLQKLKDTLSKYDSDLLIVLAPGKASYYPEFIPNEYDLNSIGKTNYSEWESHLCSSDLYFIDFHRWFRENKSTTQYNLFPKTGIHWSKYAELLVADSILSFAEKIKDKSYPSFEIDTLVISKHMRGTDDDIEAGMNLLFNIPDLEMAYPTYRIITSETSDHLSLLSVGDSYYWGLFPLFSLEVLKENSEFWFYSKQVFPVKGGASYYADKADIRKKAVESDIILLLSTDANLDRFAFGFIDYLYNAFYSDGDLSEIEFKRKRISEIIQAIYATPEWLSSIEEQANNKGVDLEELIRENAEYVFWKESQEK